MSVLQPSEGSKSLSKSPSSLLSVNSIGKLSNGEDIYGAIIYTSQPDALRAAGINPMSVLPDFVTAHITAADLIRLSNLDAVNYVDADELKYPSNDVSKNLTGADLLHSGYINNTPYKGNGVIIGIIDTGIDWKHPDFRNPADQTKSRVQYIWDQTLSPQGSEVNPSGFSYGVEYTKTQIENELDGSPSNFVREQDTHGHGSHVAGSAAGSGTAASTRNYGGMAPEAELIIVKAGNGSFPTTNIIDALTYIKNKAAALGRPAVVNMSLGSLYGSHDGTDAMSAAIDNFSGNGRVVVLAAGNDGNAPIHISGTVPSGGSTDITLTVPSYTPASGAQNDVLGFDAWLADNSKIDVSVISPNNITTVRTADNSITNSTADGYVYINNTVSQYNSDREILAEVYDYDANRPPVSGTWRIRLTNNTAAPVTFHGWLFSYYIGGVSIQVSGGNTSYTLGNSANSAIIVGSYASRWRWQGSNGSYYWGTPDRSDNISAFSSLGPTRDGRMKPDITAPGQGVFSVRSADSSPDPALLAPGGLYVLYQGTSMATPITTGAAALLLQKDNSLSYTTIRSLISSNALQDSYTGSTLPNNTWGAGKLDVFKAMTKLYNSGLSFSRDILLYDQWDSNLMTSIAAGTKAAVKFSPSSTGKLTGCLFHTSSVSSLTGPLSFEIWNENQSGLPGSKIGNTVTVAKDYISDYSWNYLNLSSANVNITAGSNFFIVMYYSSGSASFAFDNGASTNNGRTFMNPGSGWVTYSSDLRMRAVVTQDVSQLPVELIAFSGTVKNNLSVALNWSTATEVNSFMFEVERRSLPSYGKDLWQKIGELKAGGNCSSPRDYTFVDKNISAGRNYNYRLKIIDLDGSYEFSETITAELMKPSHTELMQNFPNPFNPSTKINYTLASDTPVKLKVYNVLGSEVATLKNEFQPAGSYTVDFDGSKLAAGVYIYKLEAGQVSQIKKFVLVK